jgi:hypothetical protein
VIGQQKFLWDKMSDLVSRIRKNIAEIGGSELKARATNEGLQQLWADKQSLLAEMNQAKRAAAEAAAKPYLDLIQELDEQYAVLLQFVGDNKD